MSFFSVPLSGLNASQSALQAVSSNLANVSTDGYKDQNVTFSDVFAQTGIVNGAKDPIQAGGGVTTASTTSNFTDGPTTATNINTNAALKGPGFFVVRQGSGQEAYSRAGDFTTDSAGQLVAPDGSLVLGYPAVNGVVNTTAPLQPLTVGTGQISPAAATSNFSASVNLDASAAVGDNSANSTVNLYDSLGNQHTLQVTYTKTAANTWTYSATVPSKDLAAPASATAPNQQVASGTLSFDTSGNLTAPVDANGKPAPVSIAIPAFADGAAAQNLTWSLADKNGNSLLSQSALKSGTTNLVQNGNAAGALSDFSILADGTLQAKFTSGTTAAIGQLAVATVTNTQGLQQIGNNLFQATAGSGQAEIGIAGTGGRGTITGGSVEGSNVNVANEFSKLIVAQQAYQANAKTVTTFNQIEQATLAILQ